MTTTTEPGIYVESKGASASAAWPNGVLGKRHLYLVYQKEDGSREVIRGGDQFAGFGKIQVESGVPQSDSSDKNTSGEVRPARRLDIPAGKLQDTWNLMKSDADEIQQAGVSYDSFVPGDDVPESNSNSVVRRIIEKHGFDPTESLPPGVTEKDVPGYENNLQGQFTYQQRRQEVMQEGLRPTQRRKDLREVKERVLTLPVPQHESSRDGNKTGSDTSSVSEAPVGVGLGAKAARNAAEDAETNASQSATGDATSDAVPESARAKAMAIVASGKNGRGVDQGTDLDLDSVENDLDDLMLKQVDDLTEDEAKALGQWSWKLPSNDPKRLEIEGRRRDFYELNYGDKPSKLDETGRMTAPEPVRKIPAKSKRLATPNGEPVGDALKRFAGKLARPVADDGETNVVKALQSGLSMLGDVLKVDGVSGPKTKAALKRTVARRGAGKAEEAFAVGRFKRFAETERDTGGSASKLRQTVEKDVQPLFGSRKPTVAAETLQESINDMNAKSAKERNTPAPEPLKVDGDIGPKTTDAFRSALASSGPEKLTRSYTSMLGFGD